MKVLSLFDGMSVAQQALKDAGIPVEVYYASEIDEYAKSVTQANHPDTIQLGSVVDIKYDTFDKCLDVNNYLYNADIDLLVGGSPCQDLSIAKKNREGLDGSRSSLFWEYVRILKEVKPKYFILENVASMPKEAKEIITRELGVEPIMINAALVSAQNRKRLFWTNIPNVTQPEDKGILLRDILEENVDEKYFIKNVNLIGIQSNIKKELDFVGGIRNKDWAKDGKNYSRNFGQGDRVYSPEGKSTTLSAMGGGRGAKTGLYATQLNNSKQFGNATSDKGKAYTLRASNPNGVGNKDGIRKLTPTECLRLQSMPDDYFDKALYKGKPISNTQRYKMCGNAFNKEVIVHILRFINQ